MHVAVASTHSASPEPDPKPLPPPEDDSEPNKVPHPLQLTQALLDLVVILPQLTKLLLQHDFNANAGLQCACG